MTTTTEKLEIKPTQPKTQATRGREWIYHPRGLEVDIVYGCNLKCPQCSHGAQFNKGYCPLDEFVEWCEPWAKRIKPRKFTLIGGEPTLHPQLVGIIQETKRIWHHAESFSMLTNGTLPHKLTHEVLSALKGFSVMISVKPYMEMLGEDYTKEIHESIRLYQQYGIHVKTRNNTLGKWIRDPWLPLNTDPKVAFKGCWPRTCPQPIYKGKLYRCLLLEIWQKMHEIGKIDWVGLMDYKPLEPDCSDEEIRKLIEHQEACEQCRFCPPRHTIAYGETTGFPGGIVQATCQT